jgi:hypothetical protein
MRCQAGLLTYRLINVAVSMGRRNTSSKSTCRGVNNYTYPRASIQTDSVDEYSRANWFLSLREKYFPIDSNCLPLPL